MRTKIKPIKKTAIKMQKKLMGNFKKHIWLILIVSFGASLMISAKAEAQSDVTFQVDITDLLNDVEFNPDEDRVELVGNQYPLSSTQPLEMKRDEDTPTLFKVTVSFPGGTQNTQLEYQFRAMIDNRYEREDIPRSLRLTANNQTLDALYFNSYAW